MRQKIFLITCGELKCHVRATDEKEVHTLLTQYGVKDFTVVRAAGKSKLATSVWECVRDTLRKQK
jgi:hypothetical protein